MHLDLLELWRPHSWPWGGAVGNLTLTATGSRLRGVGGFWEPGVEGEREVVKKREEKSEGTGGWKRGGGGDA